MAGAVYLPLTYIELQAWTQYTGNRPTYLERRAIDAFDAEFTKIMNAR